MRPELPIGLSSAPLTQLIDMALREDLGTGGDITSAAILPSGVQFTGVMAARHDMTIAGLGIAGFVFKTVNPAIRWTSRIEDGATASAGCELATVSGPAQDVLTAERTALNLLQYLSGIATLSRQYVNAVNGTGATILDTRKTVPGYRELAKYAARMGGVTNHRMRLDDAVLIKDNHIVVAGGIKTAIQRAKDAGHQDIEIECDTLAQVSEALEMGVDAILLDNMSNAQLVEAVDLIGDQARSEASGGVNLETVHAIALTGVKTISIGRLTQSAPAVDIGFDWKPDA